MAGLSNLYKLNKAYSVSTPEKLGGREIIGASLRKSSGRVNLRDVVSEMDLRLPKTRRKLR